MPCAAILVLIRLASRTVSLGPPSKRRWSRSGNSISQRVGASLRPLLVKCGLSSGGCEATRSVVPFREKARRTTDLSASVNYDSRRDWRCRRPSPAAPLRPPNQVVFVVFNTPKIAGTRCARLVRTAPSRPQPQRGYQQPHHTAYASRCPDRKLIAPHWKRPQRENSYGNRHFSAASACDTVPYQYRLELCQARKRRLA